MCKTEYVLPLFFMPEAENKNTPPETFAKMFQGECWRFIGLYHGPWRLLKGSSVELEGVEPSSKQGNHMLSTCLSLPSFSCIGRTRATNLYLSS